VSANWRTPRWSSKHRLLRCTGTFGDIELIPEHILIRCILWVNLNPREGIKKKPLFQSFYGQTYGT
jgi:hypothetical protein